MRVMLDGGQDGQPLFRHPAAVGAQGGSPCLVGARRFRHAPIQALIMSRS
jgi:hypothetical protein